MAAKQEDFEGRYFDQLDRRFDSVDASIAHNTKATEKGFRDINSRLTKVENKVFPARRETAGSLPPVLRDPQVLKLLSSIVLFLILLAVIYAALRGIKLPSLP